MKYLPIWALSGNVVLDRKTDKFIDRNSNEMMVNTVTWRDVKGKIHETVHWVRFLN